MNNNRTPGFYILEEERCRREYESIRRFANTSPEVSNDCIRLMFDRINVLQNCPDATATQIGLAEIQAYKQLQIKKKTTFFKKLNEFIK